MENRATGRNKRQTSSEFYKELFKLTIWGGVVFWAVTFPFSLLPIAAVFRAALSISYIQMILVESVLGGMIISCCLSYILLRFFEKMPTRNPILSSALLGFAALCIDVILVYVAASRTSDTLNIFLIGVTLNVPRFLALGIAVGYLYKRLHGREHLF
jgi:hypothetical protein